MSLNVVQYALPGLTIIIGGFYLSRRTRVKRSGSKRRIAAYEAGLLTMVNSVKREPEATQ
jgi:hypothetical protein